MLFYKAVFLGTDINITSIFILHNSFFEKIIIQINEIAKSDFTGSLYQTFNFPQLWPNAVYAA